jgi:4-hydroxybenzoate polyprenyltransferase
MPDDLTRRARAEARLPLGRRLWIYQAERFPVLRSGALIAMFSAAGVSLSAVLAARPLPAIGSYAVAFVVAFIGFFQLRAADEVKDAQEDRRCRPERPVPRGLVTLRLLVALAVGGAVVQGALTLWLDARLLLVLAVVWGWMALMAAEFGAPAWLRARPLAYLVTHMMIMPLIDLFVTACEWVPRAGTPPAALVPFLLLSFANGCVLEIGRKTWAPENERPGVESYSRLWGPRGAVAAWALALAGAAALMVAVGRSAGAVLWVVGAGALFGMSALAAARAYLRRPVPAAQASIDRAAGLWVLGSYLAVGFGPVLARALA